MSIVTIICSIPMSIAAEETLSESKEVQEDPIVAESFEYSDPNLDWQGLPIDLSQKSEFDISSSDRSTIYVPDGIYAFQNLAHSNMWIDTRADSYNADTYIQQYTYGTAPTDPNNFARGGLFKISRHPTHGTYIIRSMLNNRMSFKPYVSGNNTYIKTYAIPLNDNDVPINQTFNIEYVDSMDGCKISPYNSELYITSPSSTASGSAGGMDSCLLFDSLIDRSSFWTLTNYSGSYKTGYVFEKPASWTSTGLVTDTYYDPRLITWSTQINRNTPNVALKSGCEDKLHSGGGWSASAGRFTMTTAFPGEIQLNIGIAFSNSPSNAATLATLTYRIVPKAGDYYIQNAATEKYMYTSGTSASTSSNPLQYQYNQNFPLMKWEIQHVANSGGYVRIKSKGGNVYLGVDSTDKTDIVLSSSLNNDTLWKIDVTSRKTLVFRCKGWESSGYVMYAPNSDNNAAIQQTTYVNNTNLSDEWHIYKLSGYTVNVSVLYDNAYSNRYSNAYSRISNQILVLQEKYMQEFGINVNDLSLTSFSSYADTYCTTTPTVECSHNSETCRDSLLYTNGATTLYSLHHTNIYNIMLRISFPDLSSAVKVAYIGHELCTESNHTDHPYYGLTYESIGLATIMNFSSEASETKTFIHEFGHFYGIEDHYGGLAKTTEQIIAATGNTGYSKYCIYGERKESTSVLNDFTICDGCKTTLRNNMSRFDH